jgi:hypothetical protein
MPSTNSKKKKQVAQSSMSVTPSDVIHKVERIAKDKGIEETLHMAGKGLAKVNAPMLARAAVGGATTAARIGFGGLPTTAMAAAMPQPSFDAMKREPYLDTGETKQQYAARKESGAKMAARKANPSRYQMFTSNIGSPAYAGQSKVSKLMGVGRKGS